MNKGLEVIEAHHLFGVPYERIRVLIHPQSIVHSLVRFADGAVLGHLGLPDMRVPIGYALTYPDRAPLPMVQPARPGRAHAELRGAGRWMRSAACAWRARPAWPAAARRSC